jgi:hypothetical protein
MSSINPQPFVFDSPAGLERARLNREYMKANQHLALQFPIKELRSTNPQAYSKYFHPTFPGRMTLVVAPSHSFKTEWTNFWAKTAAVELSEQMNDGKRRGVIVKISTEDAIESLVESEIASFGGGKLDDISMGDIKNPEAFVQAEAIVGGLPIVHIGESLGMDDSNAALLCLSNIAKLVDYIRKDHFGEETPIAAIFLDYLQALPFDKEVAAHKNMTDSRTLQINRDVDTFRRMVKHFACPGVMAAQAPPEEQSSVARESIKLPGFWDVHWSKYPPQRTDFMYSLWMPKLDYKIGEMVGNTPKNPKWNFPVRNNSLWIKCLKHKKHVNVGASFPLLIQENGDVVLDEELHRKIATMERG